MQHSISPAPDGRVWFTVATFLIAAGVLSQHSAWHPNLMLTLNHAASLLPDIFWSCFTVSGLGWAVLILVSVMSRRDFGARIVLTGFLLGGLLTHTLKPWLNLPRPGAVLPADMLHFIGNPVINHVSMPSGHALAAICMGTLWVCLVRTHQYPKWLEWLAWVIVTTIAISRIAVGAHWPADVLVGAGIGLMVGWIAWRFPLIWPQSTEHAFPWLAILIEGLGAWAAFTFEEGMPLGLIWQWMLGSIAVLSIVWRLYAWRSQNHAKANP